MYLFDIASVPIDLVGDIDRFEERLGAFFTARDFPMRLVAHSTAFPMHEPIAAVRDATHRVESLYARTRALRAAIDTWCHDHTAVDLADALLALDERAYDELRVQLREVGFDLASCFAERVDIAQWGVVLVLFSPRQNAEEQKWLCRAGDLRPHHRAICDFN